MTKRGQATGLGPALNKLVNRLDRRSSGGWRNVRVTEIWPDVVGASIAAHTGRLFFRDGELVVYVDSPIWASELGAMSEMLRSRVNQALGKDDVKSIRFTVSREVSNNRRQAQREEAASEERTQQVATAPLSEEELANVRQSVSGIPDEALREAAFRATVKHLEWSKGIEASKGP